MAGEGTRRAGSVRPIVASSWRRSQDLGAGQDAAHLPPVRLTGSDLEGYRGRHPLARSLPMLQGLLGDCVSAAECVYAVGDAAGMLLWVCGDSGTLRRAHRINFVEGAVWSEATAGTNAPGTALASGRPVQVVGHEHYNTSVQRWSCAAAPVRDPDSGRTLGVLDITGGADVAAPLALALAGSTAQAIECDLRRRMATADTHARDAFARAGGFKDSGAALISPGGRVLHAPARLGVTGRLVLPQQPAGIIAVPEGRQAAVEPIGPQGYLLLRLIDAAGEGDDPLTLRLTALGSDTALLEVDGRAVRLSPRHSEIVVLLSMAPRGLSAGQLAVELSFDDRATMTIRAEMSRLRAVLGPEVVGSQPYLLRRPVRSDVDALLTLLAQGRVAEAASLYPGPLLPTSEAPAIIERRSVIDQQLRGAVLTSSVPQLLRDWVSEPWGVEDVSAWQALARALPPGSPQRAGAAQRARCLDAELRAATPLLPRRS